MELTKRILEIIKDMPQAFVTDGFVEQALIQIKQDANKKYVPKVLPLLEKKVGKKWLEEIKSRESYSKQDYQVALCNNIDDLKEFESREQKVKFVDTVHGFLEAFATGLLVHFNYDVDAIAKALKSKDRTRISDYCYHLDNYDELVGWSCDIWSVDGLHIEKVIWVEEW